MSKKKDSEKDSGKSQLVFEVDPAECPFREFKDSEISTDLWGLCPAACRAAILLGGKAMKSPLDRMWVDDQTQPLPASVRQYLHGWVRAEDLADDRWDAEVVIYEEDNNESSKMSVIDTQLSHTQVLTRSAFCRKVLSACYILERAEGLQVEHQWENFVASFGPEGWRARYHIYSPGMKPGGGPQHRPWLSKNGCYMVRLFYLGAWRCVWVSDQIPVDATDAPLLPFSPLLHVQPPKPGTKSAPTAVLSSVVHLWPLLICKALLKLAAPNMEYNEDVENVEDEPIEGFDIMHALTGGLIRTYDIKDEESLWKMLTAEIPVFSWEDDDETVTSTVRSKAKKSSNKEVIVERSSLATLLIEDSKHAPAYMLPGITPGYEMSLIVTMARDLPLKKPLPEPEVALWKYYRWVDWAKGHGLYDDYACPRTRYLKVNGLMKLSYAPHLLDVVSTESITVAFREEHDKTHGQKKGGSRGQVGGKGTSSAQAFHIKEELREWVQYDPLYSLGKTISVLYYPSMFEFTSAASSPPIRVTKTPLNRAIDITAPKSAPLYLQIDGPEENCLKLSLTALHPRVLSNSGILTVDYVEPAYLIVERFEWFVNCEVPVARAFVETRRYESVDVKFLPGRHYCRLWVHSRLNWHAMLLSESALLLGTRDVVMAGALRECAWAARFLNNLSAAFSAWARISRSNFNVLNTDREFFRSYQPDLVWDDDAVQYNKALLHWMFRQALQSHLQKRLAGTEYQLVCEVLRHYFCDPDFGLPPKPAPPRALRDIVGLDPCDCVIAEPEEMEEAEEYMEEEVETEEKPVVGPELMQKLLQPPVPPVVSQVCELATEELPCGVLKEEREKVVKKHEAATLLQACWRGTWARKCLNQKCIFTPEVLKISSVPLLCVTSPPGSNGRPALIVSDQHHAELDPVMEHAFGNLESLSALMDEFFGMFPTTKPAYSVASALRGDKGLLQHQGTSSATGHCKWIPYFQGIFFCHAPVKVHFDIQSSLQYSTVMVYNNDTGLQMPQAYNAHITFEFSPNTYGYTVMGHGTLIEPRGVNFEVHWQLTALSSLDQVFHVCDNNPEGCLEQPMQGVNKLHIDDIFLPNRRNILGGILISVTKEDTVCFRAAATSHELDIVATLRSITPGGEVDEIIAHCGGKGEIHWPYIRLQPHPPDHISNAKRKSLSQGNLLKKDTISGRSQPKSAGKPAGKGLTGKNKSLSRIKPAIIEPKQYSIEVTAPDGWPLTLAQWKRVDEIRNSVETTIKTEVSKKTPKPATGKSEKDKPPAPAQPKYTPQPDDAYIELECSLAIGGGAVARRDDMRDQQFAVARMGWDALEPGRNQRGAQIRSEFREEFLVPAPLSESLASVIEEGFFGEDTEELKKPLQLQQGPTPATESGLMEEMEIEEEIKYLLMPEQLKDKFVPLYFLPLCMKEKIEEDTALVTNDMAEAAKKDRHARIEAALERMKELQAYNEIFVLGRQKRRCQLLDNLSVDSTWSPVLAQALEERDEAIVQETLMRTISANKKKQDTKKGK